MAAREKIGPGEVWAWILLALRRNITVASNPSQRGEFFCNLSAQRNQGLNLLRRIIIGQATLELNAN